jgi:glycyl-tRNA synthetase beta chain
MADFFLEVRCEEIPAAMLAPGIKGLGTSLFEELMARRIAPAEVRTAFTPRRLVVELLGMPEREPDRSEELTGPPVSAAWDAEGRPTPALGGFARKCGVAVEELRRLETPRGEYVAATLEVAGRPAAEVLAEVVPATLRGMPWPRVMRWGTARGPWVRPVHSVIALLDGRVVPFELFGVESGRRTLGHPLRSPEPIEVADAADYRRQLAARSIVVDFDERRARLLAGMRERAAELGGELVADDALLDKLASICEIPGVVAGRIERTDLPREVLVTSLRDHQSALTVEKEGRLLPCFLTVMDRADDPQGRVRRGNEWVVEARLSDARFFFAEDRKRSLEARREDLARVTFHEKLGSYAEKSERLVELSRWLALELGHGEAREASARAAALLKTDLTTEMVKEFTSLQGVVGGVYAREEGLDEAVWQSLYDQYLPASADDSIPRRLEGRLVSLADRLDTLVGMFGCGFAPTGSKDPFGLRRAAQGVVRILLEGDLPLDLDAAVRRAAALYGSRLEVETGELAAALRPFFADRMRFLLGREGFAHDEIEAALAAAGSTPPDQRRRAAALAATRDAPGFLDVVLAAKRIANILRGTDPVPPFDPGRLAEPAEIALRDAAVELERDLERTEAAKLYDESLRHIASFAAVLDRFFVDVLVMADDPAVRANRLGLLGWIQELLSRVAGFTEMVVERPEAGAE